LVKSAITTLPLLFIAFKMTPATNDELKEDKLSRNDTGQSAPGNTNPSTKNFNIPRCDARKLNSKNKIPTQKWIQLLTQIASPVRWHSGAANSGNSS
jgi:hypothetical protein